MSKKNRNKKGRTNPLDAKAEALVEKEVEKRMRDGKSIFLPGIYACLSNIKVSAFFSAMIFGEMDMVEMVISSIKFRSPTVGTMRTRNYRFLVEVRTYESPPAIFLHTYKSPKGDTYADQHMENLRKSSTLEPMNSDVDEDEDFVLVEDGIEETDGAADAIFAHMEEMNAAGASRKLDPFGSS